MCFYILSAKPRAYINNMIIVVVHSNIGVIRVEYLHVAPVSPSPKHCAPLLGYDSTLKITSIHLALCFMKILPYSKIRLLQTGCLRIAMRVARSYYNARLRVAGLRCVLFTYFLKGCSWHETNLVWIFDINLLLIIAREILTVILKLSFIAMNVNHPTGMKWTSSQRTKHIESHTLLKWSFNVLGGATEHKS